MAAQHTRGVTSDRRATSWGFSWVIGTFVAVLSRPAECQPSDAALGNAPPGDTTADPREPGPDDFLVWQAPVGCSTAAAVRERVGELLGHTELDLKHVRHVQGRVRQTGDGWALTLILVDALGQRERQIESPLCADLAEAAAVAISLAFEAARAREQAERAEAAVAPEAGPMAPIGNTEPAAPDGAEAAPPAAPDSRPKGALEPWLGAEVWLDAHALPAVAAGVSAVGSLRASELRLGAFVALLPGVDRTVAPGQSVSFSLLLGGVRACYTLGQGLVDTALCAGLEGGRLAARGSGLLSARNANDLWVAPQLGIELSSALTSHLGVQLRGDAIVPLLRQGYAVNETEDVHHVPGLGVRAGFGFIFGF